MFMSVICVHTCSCHGQSEDSVRFPGVTIPGSCDTTYMDEGTLTQAFCKNSKGFLLLNHHFSQKKLAMYMYLFTLRSSS